jgi:hypothetical protein
MLRSGSLLLLGLGSILLLAGCGSSSYSSVRGQESGGSSGMTGSTGPGNPIGGGGGATGSSNTVLATPSVSMAAGVVGTHQTISFTFTSSDGQPISGFGISGNLSALPAGWSGPPSFACASVSTGSGCVLNLTYAPTAPTNGTLVLNYVFVANSGVPNTTGSLSLAYVATPADNVLAAASPNGQITAVVATGTQNVAVTFNTDDGTVATGLTLTTDLTALPAGWSAASPTFTCASVSTGNGCQLQLSFAPSTLVSGTLVLNFGYTDDAGIAKTGTLNLAYTATTNDSVVATPSPTGQINAVVGAAAQPVVVTFTTNDGLPASQLQLTDNLAALPAGWTSSVGTFTCAGVSTGNGCQLNLSYAPTVAGSGTLLLTYTYVNDAGVAGSGSLNINYQSTTSDTVIGTPSPNPFSVASSSTGVVTVTFTTNDANPASGLIVNTTDLSSLPTGWSGPGTFTCATVSTGTGCQLSLTYAPTAVATGTLVLHYTYNDDSGTAKAGTASITYAATPPPYLYLASLGHSVSLCSLDGNGQPISCSATGGVGFASVSGIAFYGTNFAYVADWLGNAVDVCAVSAVDGTLSNCTPTGSSFNQPWQLAVEGATLYATNSVNTGGVTTCAIAIDGTLSGCTATTGTGTAGIAVGASFGYVGVGAATVDVCAVSAQGVLSACAATGNGFSGLDGISLSGGHAYVANTAGGNVSVCAVSPVDGTLSACTTSTGTLGVEPADVALNGSHAYVSNLVSDDFYVCAVGNTGALLSCALSNPFTPDPSPPANQVAVH